MGHARERALVQERGLPITPDQAGHLLRPQGPLCAVMEAPVLELSMDTQAHLGGCYIAATPRRRRLAMG